MFEVEILKQIVDLEGDYKKWMVQICELFEGSQKSLPPRYPWGCLKVFFNYSLGVYSYGIGFIISLVVIYHLLSLYHALFFACFWIIFCWYFWKRILNNYIRSSIEGDLKDVLDRYKERYWVIRTPEKKDRIIGMIALDIKKETDSFIGREKKNSESYIIRRFSVQLEYQRRGLGRLLMNELEEFTKKMSIEEGKSIQLKGYMACFQFKAIPFYKRRGFGFKKVKSSDNFWRNLVQEMTGFKVYEIFKIMKGE